MLATPCMACMSPSRSVSITSSPCWETPWTSRRGRWLQPTSGSSSCTRAWRRSRSRGTRTTASFTSRSRERRKTATCLGHRCLNALRTWSGCWATPRTGTRARPRRCMPRSISCVGGLQPKRTTGLQSRVSSRRSRARPRSARPWRPSRLPWPSSWSIWRGGSGASASGVARSLLPCIPSWSSCTAAWQRSAPPATRSFPRCRPWCCGSRRRGRRTAPQCRSA
mmetsp:Transcript_109425/g.349196  ORF Transcript_109425/g.349196 Transcript_109425/m.349196 type:complete len:223 (-) Transcript_109425:1421-2089(-)